MNTPPFTAANELYRRLHISPDRTSILRISSQPTSLSSQKAKHASPEKKYLPGQPQVALTGPGLPKYLHSEFVTPDLNNLSPYLWLVAKQDSAHVSPLTEQLVRGRRTVVTENPELHLTWAYDVVYLKPIPKYLLSHAFWEFYLTNKDSPIVPEALRDDIARAALGFLRSYFYLIRHKSDFLLATDETVSLLPKGVRFSMFMRFIAPFEKVNDAAVSPRYRFGQLRLTRLNFWAKAFLGRFTFHKLHWQYAAQFKSFYGPLLFIFGLFSVALSAMQVVLATQGSISAADSWVSFRTVSSVFSVLTLCVITIAALFLIAVLFAQVLREALFALKDLYRKNRSGYGVD